MLGGGSGVGKSRVTEANLSWRFGVMVLGGSSNGKFGVEFAQPSSFSRVGDTFLGWQFLGNSNPSFVLVKSGRR